MHEVRTVGQDLHRAAVVWLGYSAISILISCIASLSLPPSANGPHHLGYAGTVGLLLGFGAIMGLVGVWSARISWTASMRSRLAHAALQPDGVPLPRSRWALFVMLYGGALLAGSEAYYTAFHLPQTANVMGWLFVFVGTNWFVLARNIQAFEREQRRRYYWQRAPLWAFTQWSLVYLTAE